MVRTSSTQPPVQPVIVACLGSSTTAGKGQAFGWIDELAKRPQNQRFRFCNLGVGGDLAYNALQRVPNVVACHPGKVVIMVGANDALTLVFKNVRRVLGGWMKHLPQTPSPDWFRANLEAIVRRLKEETSAQLGIASLGQIGESLDSTDPVQHELNVRIQQDSEIIKEIAAIENATYIPFTSDFVSRSPSRRAALLPRSTFCRCIETPFGTSCFAKAVKRLPARMAGGSTLTGSTSIAKGA